MLSYYSVQPRWELKRNAGFRSAFHYVVAAEDEVDAARQVFDILRPKTPTGTWRNKRPPDVYNVSRMMTPKEFVEQDVGHMRLTEDHDEDTPTPWDAMDEMFMGAREVRL